VEILRTKRLTLREFTEEDSAFIFKLLNSPGWLKYIGQRGIKIEDDAKDYINNKLRKSYKDSGFGFYLAELNAGKIPIGMCGIIKREWLDDVDIGFALLPEFEGRGFAYEAASATMKYASEALGLKKISAITVPNNLASVKLLEKIGLSFTRMIRIPVDKEELMLFTNYQPNEK
jgi:RimJ/RimL family protein N-acetyltransferase